MFEAGSVSEARKVIENEQPHGAVVDYSLPDGNGLAVIERILEVDANAAIILLTAHGTIDLAVQAVKRGAEQFLRLFPQLVEVGRVGQGAGVRHTFSMLEAGGPQAGQHGDDVP